MKRNNSASAHENGSALLLAAFSVVVMLLMVGLTVDLGGAYVTHARLSKAVDAGALAGVRHIQLTDAQVHQNVLKMVNANYRGRVPATFDVQITRPSADATRVTVAATTKAPTFFAKLIGQSNVNVAAVAAATRYPLDLSFALDVSGSLQQQGVFGDMQDASSNFLDYFDDDTDQLGLVIYSTSAEEKMSIRKNFKFQGKSEIAALRPLSWTNTEEALRLAKVQLDTAPQRPDATKIVVLFTDGRPTAFRDSFEMAGPPSEEPAQFDGVVAGVSDFGGLYQWQDGRRVGSFLGGLPVLGSGRSPEPQVLPGPAAVNGANIRALGIAQSEAWADQLRAAGYTVYAIALGNPMASDPLAQPDLPFLQRLANAGGISDPLQPRGEMLFAPNAAALEQTFVKLADRILLRLTQ